MAKFLSREEYKAFKAGQKAAREAAIDASDRAATERPGPSGAAVFGLKAAALTAIDTMFNGELAKCATMCEGFEADRS